MQMGRSYLTSNLDVRPSSIAGQWYSADPKSLAASVDRYIRLRQPP